MALATMITIIENSHTGTILRLPVIAEATVRENATMAVQGHLRHHCLRQILVLHRPQPHLSAASTDYQLTVLLSSTLAHLVETMAWIEYETDNESVTLPWREIDEITRNIMTGRTLRMKIDIIRLGIGCQIRMHIITESL
jgi:hypothetical protein